MTIKTQMASLKNHQKGNLKLINDSAKSYVHSNIYEVASNAKPYEKIAVAKNFQYLVECLRAEGQSTWFASAHDEFALVMDESVTVHFIKLTESVELPNAGAKAFDKQPIGHRMGKVLAKRGHMVLLPKGVSYQFEAARPAVILLQTKQGELTQERWSEICGLQKGA